MTVMLSTWLASATQNGSPRSWPSATTNHAVATPTPLVAVRLRCRVCSREWTGYRRVRDDVWRDEDCVACGHMTAGPVDEPEDDANG